MQRGSIGPGEIRAAEITDLPDGRVRLTRWRKVSPGRKPATDMFLDWGVLDTASPSGVAGGAADVRLINQMVGDVDGEPALVQVYEEIPESAEIQVGENTLIQLEDGRTAIEAEFLQFSTGTYAPGTVGSTTAPGDASAFLQRAEQSNDGTLRRIKRTYVYAGQISQSDETLQGGKALTRTIVSVKTVPSTPSGYTLIRAQQTPYNGIPTYTYTYAKGEGLVSQLIASRQDGLREVTNIALGTRSAPAGIVTRDDYREADGYKIYTVGCLQSAAGGSVTDATLSLPRTVPWTYPGRALPYSRVAQNGQTVIDVFRSPPVATEIEATVDVTYQTSDSLGSLDNPRWQPIEWATWEAEWITSNNSPRFSVVALPGYRSMSETPISLDVDVWEDTLDGGTIFGEPIYGGTTAVLKVFGGPDAPDGSTFTLDASLEPAFTGTDGTKYYRRTVVSATIPNQPDLPDLS